MSSETPSAYSDSGVAAQRLMDAPPHLRRPGCFGASGSTKMTLTGTHRVRRPEETWELIKKMLGRFGITRIADVTWLDDIGIPVWQAIRPNARMISVSQGKGLSPLLAKISAAMESIELWHAEHLDLPSESVSVGHMSDRLGYRLDDLPLQRRNIIHPGLTTAWILTDRLDGSGTSYVPSSYVSLDGRVNGCWTQPRFVSTSNGLASGNTYTEAVVHGLYEVIERDAIAQRYPRQGVPLDMASVDGIPGTLAEKLRDAGFLVQIALLPSRIGVPSFTAHLWRNDFPVEFEGSGSHLDREVALCRAITEAAQSRLTAITGSREDIASAAYTWGPGQTKPASSARERRSVSDVPTVRIADVGDELRELVERIKAATGRIPMAVNHTRREFGIPVVHVICPRMRYPDGY